MSANVYERINKILGSGGANDRAAETKSKAEKIVASGTGSYNPFLDKDGNLFNKYINYQKILDNPKVTQTAKKYIMQATGLVPSYTAESTGVSSFGVLSQQAGVKNVPTASYTAASTGNSIADTAQKYIGTPYVWGGESISEGGMDCSGFVYNALKDAGYNIGRTTAQGYRSYGNTVSKSDMQPGDLIFYGNNGRASHIGIYLGNGQMIHSSGDDSNTKSNPGKGVSVTNVDYRNDFLEARRY